MADILLFSTQITGTGGIENHLVRFCDRLAPIGAKITLLCPDYRPSLGLHQRFRTSCKQLVVLPSRKRPSPITKFCWLFWALLQLQYRSFESLYLNGQGLLPFWVWKSCGWRAQRCVVHHHSSGDPDDVDTWPSNYYKLLHDANSIVACSRSNASLIASVVRRPVRVIYCFTEPCVPRVFRATSSQLAFGFIGRLIPEKGVDTILRLSLEADLPNIHWHLWGSLDGYSTDFSSAYPNVTFHGLFDSRDGLNQAMDQLDAFTLFSTHREGLPLTLLEAMSAGVPWIASDRGGIRDLKINNTDTILLPQSFTYLDALDATRRMADSLHKKLIDPGALIKFYRSHFDPEVISEQWRELLFTSQP